MRARRGFWAVSPGRPAPFRGRPRSSRSRRRTWRGRAEEREERTREPATVARSEPPEGAEILAYDPDLLRKRVPPRLDRRLDVPVDMLGLLELLQTFLAQLASQARHLHAAERTRRVVDQGVVDPDVAGLNLLEIAPHLLRIVREKRRAEPVR